MQEPIGDDTASKPQTCGDIGPVPRAWTIAPLKSLFSREPSNGLYRPQADYGQGTLILRIDDFGNEGDIVTTARNRVNADESDRLRFSLAKNDLVLNRVNSLSHLGKTALIGDITEPMLFESNMMRFRVDERRIRPDFAFRVLNSEVCKRQLGAMAKRAVAQSSVNQGDVAAVQIPLPPRAEQDQIAAVLSAVQRAVERQERLIALTAELKKALMHKLFTEGTRGAPLKQTEIGPVPQNWALKRCDELCPTISVGVVVKPRSYYVDAGVPAFRSFNVREDRLVADDLVYFSRADNDGPLSKSKLRAGDILIVRTGYPGTSCVVPKEFDGANCIDLVFARPGRLIDGAYLSRFLQSEAGKRQATASSHGLAQQHLNVNAVKRVLVPLPAFGEQHEIVECLAAADRKAATHTRLAGALRDLFRTLLRQLMTAQVRVRDLDLSALGSAAGTAATDNDAATARW
jgi:type I restriction enzyme S subunit